MDQIPSDEGASTTLVSTAVLRRDLSFAALTTAALLIAHAIVLFLHEWAHSAMAWILGFKSNPLAITYGRLNLPNVLLQGEMDENVDYESIFRAGHRVDVSVIALAGITSMLLVYVVCALVLRSRASRMRSAGTMFLFWVAVMSAGDLWAYAPVRTITTRYDMANAAQGLGISTWTLLPFVTVPSIWVGWDLFSRLLPSVLAQSSGSDLLRRAFVVVVACFVYFGYFGNVGSGGSYGNVSAVLSILSVFLLFPLVVMATLSRAGIRNATERPKKSS
ncbi:hypothetical protein [Antrihabitans sp. YC2-6]|uniref:hypothetical protein n=1 Tax=Antrihabitans sp. YC2-6 TaxID=2799498 RepID=UPI0018F6A65C|nr:hypothetical protein [Antrihabitans sp. YC2-6]MBJ8346956.1 hypothetical protein [Antrihabitans sp. YC2-6]